ncbi:hypothetical protein BGW42_005135 [Actinomortierella wolfii]|nr:hypothetical protein BGW42_005135 [Actinomortierella wolfii]
MNTSSADPSNIKQRVVTKKTVVSTTTKTSSGASTGSDKSTGSSSKKSTTSSSSVGCLSILKGVTAILAILVAASFPFLKGLTTDLGLFLGPIVKLNSDLCRPVSGLESCEDIYLHRESGLAITTCGNTEMRKAGGWFPPMGHRNQSADPIAYQDKMVLYNLENGMYEVMDIENFPEGADRAFHGIDVYERSAKELTIFAINHRRTGSVIEVIEYYVGETTMKHVETIQHELIVTPNDIVALGPRSFYVSNDHKHVSGPLRVVEANLRRAWANVIYYSPEKAMVAFEGISSANGMTANHDKSIIYVSACHGAALHVMEPRDDHTLRERDYIKLDFYVDNPSLDPDTGAIFLTGHVQPLKLVMGMSTPGKPVVGPTKVVKITNNTGSDQFYGKKYKVDDVFFDDGSTISGGTVAVIDRERKAMLIGTLSERGLLKCDLPKNA